MNRRELLQSVAGVLAVPTVSGTAVTQSLSAPADDRAIWVGLLRRLADPVLRHLAAGTLKARMPVEQAAGGNRADVTHLEALGRLVAGVAPWLELAADSSEEGRARGATAELARAAIDRAVDPASPDFLNFTRGGQPLVDAAFLAHGLLRARRTLVEPLDARAARNLLAALESTRVITPGYNNWLLFSAMVEAGVSALGGRADLMRVDYAVRQHEAWYKGDGAYGDGPAFHWDYYNSFVIQPMLLDVLEVFRERQPAWKTLSARVEERARRYAAVQERLIGPDGSFPPLGRSLAYRCGAFQLLAQIALRRALPENVSPAQVRGALTAVIRRTLEAPGTFDTDGWLRIGFCGHQPGVGESYISTGSLYLCATAFLPLGLPAADAFWAAAPEPWTARRAWSGQPFAIDKAISV
ncbi:MAG TPA: DUF2264 domain-containing protein [Vicinamibacterales bacterium]|nr:DUF2264 domain-containing protein [Vicinamibacterales bacterium]